MSELTTAARKNAFYDDSKIANSGPGYVNFGKSISDAERRLFIAIDEDDIADKQVSLPQRIDLSCSAARIKENYDLCLKYWEDGVSRQALLALINKQLTTGELSEDERKEYKYIRSRYKHLRFALMLYTKTHKVPFLFRKTTVYLGRFQDAFRNNNAAMTARWGKLLKVLLSAPVWNMVNYSLRHAHLVSADKFMTYRQEQMRKLQEMISRQLLTGREFHDVRKIISQQVSFYDTLRSINPGNGQAYQVSRFMAAINGMMGDKHDELVADDLAGVRAYNEKAPLDADIRWRLEMLLERYPAY
ncbi:TPA: hypothetical protein ACXE8V_001039 [Pluralibacter gergoviae]